MGFFDDLFSGNFGAVGSDIGNFLSNPINDIALVGSALLPFAAPELLGATAGADVGASALAGAAGGAGASLGADVGAGTALGLAGDVGATAAGSDLSSFVSNPGAALTPTSGVADASALVAPTPAATPGVASGTNLVDQLTGANLTGGVATPGADVSTGAAQVGGSNLVGDISGGGGGGGSLFDKLIGGAETQITKNPIGLAAAGTGLGLSLLGGTKSSGPAQSALSAEAPVLQSQGNTLQGYLQSGTLPPALQAQLDQQIQAAKARIIANHAAQGRSTDPSQNSALAQELNNIDLQATALKGQTETQLYQQGLEDIQLSADLNKTLANFDRQDQQAVTQALANFAKAMSPSAGGIQLKLPG